MLRVVERTKACARCGECKPWSQFYPRQRWEDGSVRNVTAYCRPCAVAKAREWDRANPDKARARWREQSRRRWQDPDRASARYAYERERAARMRGTPYIPRRPKAKSPTVDAAPFAAFLRSLDTSSTTIGRICGLDESYVRKVLKGIYPVVELDTVDRVLLRADVVVDGMPVTLDTLYPLELDNAA